MTRFIKMKVTYVFILLLFFSTIQHAKSQLDPKLLVLTEIARLNSDQDLVPIVQPEKLLYTNNGEIYIKGRNQILQFDKQKRYKKNLFKQGEGPGEFKYIGGFYFSDNHLIIGNSNPSKICFFNTAGSLVNEISFQNSSRAIIYLFSYKQTHYFKKSINKGPFKTGISTSKNNLFVGDQTGNLKDLHIHFSKKNVILAKGKSLMISSLTKLMTACDNQQYAYFCHKERYEVKQFDLKIQKITNIFKRDFKPQLYYPQKGLSKLNQKIESIVNAKTFNDIYSITMMDKDLMVITSHIDTNKGVLMDRFNSSGKWLASYWLPIPGLNHPKDLSNRILTFHKGKLWTSLDDEEGNRILVQFQIKWPALTDFQNLP